MDKHQEDIDVVLIADNEKFPCNRKVLQAASPYFHAMFNSNMVESSLKEVYLHNVHPVALNALINFASTGKVSINHDNAQILLEASSMFQFEEIFQSCCKFLLDTMDVTNCVSLWVLADTLGIKVLRQEFKKCVLWNFLEIVTTQESEFLSLSKDLLIELLHHNGLNCTEELNVVKIIMQWVKSNNVSQDHMLELLSCVRYCSLNSEDLEYIRHCQLISKDSYLYKVLCKIFDTIHLCEIKQNENSDDVMHLRNSQCDEMVDLLISSLLTMQDDSENNHQLSTSLVELLKNGKCTFCSSEVILHYIASSPRSIPMMPLTVRNVCKKQEGNPNEETPYREKKCQSSELFFFIYDGTIPFKTVTSLSFGANHNGTLEGYGICAVGAVIYFFGGEYGIGSGRWNQEMHTYHMINQKWSVATSLPIPRRHFLVAVLDEKIYILGGFGRYRLVMTSVDCYNTKTDVWESLSSLPCPLFSSAAVVSHQGNIYLFTSNVYCYSPLEDSWNTVKKGHPLLGLSIGGAVSYMNDIYLFPKFNGPLILFKPSNGSSEEINFIQHRVFCVCIIEETAYAFGIDTLIKINLKEKTMETIELEETINADQCCSVPYYTIL